MLSTILYRPGDIRVEDCDRPKIEKSTDAVIRVVVSCMCGSDLWPYRGLQVANGPTPMGHEHCGCVEEVGSNVRSIKPGQFVIGSFFASDDTCPHCLFGYQSSCQHREFIGEAQAPYLRVRFADGTLVTRPEVPSDDLLPNLLAVSDVMGTDWFAADAANVKPGSTVAVGGDGVVGLFRMDSAGRQALAQTMATTSMRHISITFSDDPAVPGGWMEYVTDDQYLNRSLLRLKSASSERAQLKIL